MTQTSEVNNSVTKTTKDIIIFDLDQTLIHCEKCKLSSENITVHDFDTKPNIYNQKVAFNNYKQGILFKLNKGFYVLRFRPHLQTLINILKQLKNKSNLNILIAIATMGKFHYAQCALQLIMYYYNARGLFVCFLIYFCTQRSFFQKSFCWLFVIV